MKNAFRHTGVMFMVAVIGLAVIGAGYALWFQILTLNATVTTGTLDVQWSNHGAVEEYSTDLGQTFIKGPNNFATPTPADAGFLPAKAVQDCTQTIDEASGGHVLTISDTNLYPYAGCVHHIDIHSVGTTPVHIDTSLLDLSGLTCTTDPVGGKCNAATDLHVVVSACVVAPDSSDAGGGPNTPIAGNPKIWQLHESNRINCDIEIWANQSAPEKATYTGGIKLLACQWNEDANCSFANTGGRDNNETPTSTSTSTSTPVPPTNTPVPPTNTPEPTATSTPSI